MAILRFSDVTKRYGRDRTAALEGVSFAVEAAAFAVLLGPSGAGKTTLLRLALAVERPDAGSIQVADRDIQRLRRASIPYLRRNVGAIFQDFKLLPEATPLQNVALALEVLGLRPADVRARAQNALRRLEIDPTRRGPTRCLSGGEQQRVAVARALAGEPTILLADEPTGNLDPRLTDELLGVLAAVNASGTTVVLATHNPVVRERAPVTQVLRLDAGRLIDDSARAPVAVEAVA